jgi:outer membrane protein assembly factor BamB
MYRRSFAVCFLFLASLTELRSSDVLANWPRWRGPDQNGQSADKRVPLEWSMTKNVRWQLSLPGYGNSSPIVWGDRIFLTSATKDGSERYLICVNRQQGQILWQRTAAKNAAEGKIHEWNTFASSTPITDGERIYAYYGNPGLFCYDFEGNLIWQKQFGKLGCSTHWGIGAASPILFEDLVIVNGDHGGEGSQEDKGETYGPSWLWAMNKKTGEVVWKAERNQGMSWGTPVILATPKGRTELVLNSPHGVWSYDPRTGKELWHTGGREVKELFGEITPVWRDGIIYAFTGRPGPMYAIRMDGAGDITKSHLLWNHLCGNRVVCSPLLVGNELFEVDRNGVITCYDTATGKPRWQHRLGEKCCASLVAVRGKVIALGDEGTAYVVEPGSQFKLLHTNKLTDDAAFRASPAIADGQIFIRSDHRLFCVAESNTVGKTE